MADPFSDAISNIESGGRYGLLGPVTKSGDRAYGKFQVMGTNVGPWTEQYYGKRLTPTEFLGNPQAQDAVFQGKFVGDYVPKYGPEGAAKAWFAGERGMNNPNATDQLGTSVQGYGRQFMAGLYGNFNAPPLTPGSPAPPLPPPVNIGGQPVSGPQPAVPGQPQQNNPLQALAGLSAYPWTPQQQQPSQFQLSPNPISQMAANSQPPNTKSLQALLSPMFRGLLT